MACAGDTTRRSAPMANGQPTKTSPPAAEKPTAQHMGNVFVTNYYTTLKTVPNEFHNFYQHNSTVGRPDDNGVNLSINKKQAIDQNMLLVGDGMQVEIMAVGAQYTVDSAMIVVVKGYLIDVGGVKRGFTQTFFLNPKVLTPKVQSYYIGNDIFMYHDEENLSEHGVVNGSGVPPPLEHVVPLIGKEINGKGVNFTPENLFAREEEPVTLVPRVISVAPTTSVALVVKGMVAEKPVTLLEKDITTSPPTSVAPVIKAPVTKKPITLVAKAISVAAATSVAPMADTSPSTEVQGEAPRKSFSSIVRILKDDPTPFAIPPSVPAKTLPSKSGSTNTQPSKLSAPFSSMVSDVSSNASQQSLHPEVDCRSIFVGNLPLNTTVNQLREEFKKFGAIKPSRIRVRRIEEKSFCFAFLEFEEISAAASAIKASPMAIGGRSIFIKEKRRNDPRPLGSTSWRSSGR